MSGEWIEKIIYWVNVLHIIMVIALVASLKRLLVGGKWVLNKKKRWDSGKTTMIL